MAAESKNILFKREGVKHKTLKLHGSALILQIQTVSLHLKYPTRTNKQLC